MRAWPPARPVSGVPEAIARIIVCKTHFFWAVQPRAGLRTAIRAGVLQGEDCGAGAQGMRVQDVGLARVRPDCP